MSAFILSYMPLTSVINNITELALFVNVQLKKPLTKAPPGQISNYYVPPCQYPLS